MVVLRTLIALALLAAPAQAAEITLSKDRRTITVTGWIEPGDAKRFLKVAGKARPNATVRLSGHGGMSGDAFKIGSAIRRNKLATDVRAGDSCLSACAFMWLAGTPRKMSETALIGFHAPYDPATGKTDYRRYAHDRLYVMAMGGTEQAAAFMLVENPDGVNLLTPAKAREFGLPVSVR